MDIIKVERAIAGLTEWQKHIQTESNIDRDISTAIEALRAQLSREGTTKDTTFSCSHENDTISRQAAIDAHCELCPDRHICCPIHNGNICPDIEVFELLPSAQPELRRGEES